MTTIDPATRAWLDQEHRRTAELIRRFGVSLTYVGAAGDCDCDACRAGIPVGPAAGAAPALQTPFAYTTGLFGIGHPELLVFGLDTAMTSRVLNQLADGVRAGQDLTVGQVLTIRGWSRRILVEHVPNPGEIAFGANQFYERPNEFSVPLLQLTYDDGRGHFPDQPGYGLPSTVQPRPGTFRA